MNHRAINVVTLYHNLAEQNNGNYLIILKDKITKKCNETILKLRVDVVLIHCRDFRTRVDRASFFPCNFIVWQIVKKMYHFIQCY